MAMDFFESQDRARRRTGWLVFLFICGVIGTTLATSALGYFVGMANGSVTEALQYSLLTGIVTIAIIGISGLVKMGQMNMGGSAVAESFGGVPLETAELPEAGMVRNVVEEMAIASGVPVPPVFVMEDDTINAFAAGRSPADAAIGLTRGACQKLPRDELQGVVGHEFSHIFHGDMRINSRTTAAIFGMMVIGIIGYVLFRFVGPSILRYAGRGKKNPAPAVGLVILLLGLIIWAIGSVGTLFGRLVQAAVSRQREFLADASSVQYTRNPAGLAGALRRIASEGSSVNSRSANEAAHFYFAPALNTMFATHPPLEERVRRIEAAPIGAAPIGAAPLAPATIGRAALLASAASAGSPSFSAIESARRKLGAIDSAVAAELRTRSGAMAAVLAVASAHGSVGGDAIRSVAQSLGDDVQQSFQRFHLLIESCKPETQLVILDLCAPTLAPLSEAEAGALGRAVSKVIRGDGVLTLGEWMVQTFVHFHVLARFDPPPPLGRVTLRSCGSDPVVVLQLLSGLSQQGDVAERGLQAGLGKLGLGSSAEPPAAGQSIATVDASLSRLARLSGAEKRTFVLACIEAITPDGSCSPREAMALRAVCDSLGVPLLEYAA